MSMGDREYVSQARSGFRLLGILIFTSCFMLTCAGLIYCLGDLHCIPKNISLMAGTIMIFVAFLLFASILVTVLGLYILTKMRMD